MAGEGSVSISAGVRMCVNGFPPRSLSKGKVTASAAGRLLTPTPPGPTIPGPKPGPPAPHAASEIQTGFVILQKQPCTADLSWPQQKGPIVSTKNRWLGSKKSNKIKRLFAAAAGPWENVFVIFKDFHKSFPPFSCRDKKSRWN